MNDVKFMFSEPSTQNIQWNMFISNKNINNVLLLNIPSNINSTFYLLEHT
jgi:hypothetical protein